MYISHKNRTIVKNKFDGLCAYTGTKLEDDWQVDHLKPLIRNWKGIKPKYECNHCIENLIPAQRIINHYKGGLDIETFRTWYLGGLHKRLAKLPKNPSAEKSIKKKAYLLKVAGFFGITADKPFSGVFYFETLEKENELEGVNLMKES